MFYFSPQQNFPMNITMHILNMEESLYKICVRDIPRVFLCFSYLVIKCLYYSTLWDVLTKLQSLNKTSNKINKWYQKACSINKKDKERNIQLVVLPAHALPGVYVTPTVWHIIPHDTPGTWCEAPKSGWHHCVTTPLCHGRIASRGCNLQPFRHRGGAEETCAH